MTCPRCNGPAAGGQDYCLECGLRLPGEGRLGGEPDRRPGLARPLALLSVVALAGAAVAIAANRDASAPDDVAVAIGGSLVVESETATTERRLAEWPDGEDGWTIVLLSSPKSEGRDRAEEMVTTAQERGLADVGILDSSTVPGLHPGYWVVFTGIYDTQPEATSELTRAKSVAATAATRRIAG